MVQFIRFDGDRLVSVD